MTSKKMSVQEREEIRSHYGHAIEVATYGSEELLYDAAIECLRCGQVLFDIDLASGGNEAAAEALAKHAGHRVAIVDGFRVDNGVTLTGMRLECRKDNVVLLSEKSSPN